MKKAKFLFLSVLVVAMSIVGGTRAFSQAAGVVIVRGAINTDTTWTANNVYVLRGAVFVQAGATLTVEPGTLIAGEFATNGTLIVAQGAKINAIGTAAAPIVMTSDQPSGPPDWPTDDRFRADWGGIIINGRATINIPGGVAFGEGGTGRYGGSNDADDSGTLRYVRVEYAGTEFSPDNELNGIGFQGTGSNTTVEYVQVHMNLDDGIEMFGGTTNLKYIVLTNIADDSLDYTDGWRGKVQFLIVQQRADDADQGFEFDNNGENNDLTPRSNPTIYNVTLIGDKTPTWGGESDHGMLLREGTAGRIFNAIVLDFREVGIRVDQSATVSQGLSGNLVVGSTIVFGNGRGNFDSDAETLLAAGVWPNVVEIDPQIVDPHNWLAPDFRPTLTSPAVTGRVPVARVPQGDAFFTNTAFIGAMGPLESDDWTKTPAQWTTSAQGFTNFFPGETAGTFIVPDGRVLPRSNGDPLNDPEDAIAPAPGNPLGLPVAPAPILPGPIGGGGDDGDGRNDPDEPPDCCD